MSSEITLNVDDLILVRQDSLAKEKFSRNETLKDIHVVAKTLPFVLEISSPYDLRSARLSALLFYDCDNGCDFKAVSTAKQEPMTYKLHLSEDSRKAVFEIKVAVLSSQHEDSLFRVKIIAYFENGAAREVFSEPIKTVSKPSQVGKERKKKMSSPEVLAQAMAKKQKRSFSEFSEAPLPSASAPSATSISTSDPLVLQAIERLEREQRESKQMISNLLVSLSGKKDQIQDSNRTVTATVTATSSTGEDELETAFTNLMNALSKVNATERSFKLRKLVNNSAVDKVKDLVDTCQQVLLSKATSSPLLSSSLPLDNLQNILFTGKVQCNCQNCPARQDLDAIDGFFSELSSSSPSSDFNSDYM